ncbi:anti-sigma factor RsbA family regulatory protein [Actinoplanes sp. NPDC049118]|uniref:anti-sigma factor RsbA family regulatory protein n=1 Tax=Actinoplanes sp. NPDC049118 TaxID=3155769 RepID=UPI003410E1CA
MTAPGTTAPAIHRGRFDHPGLLYRDPGEYLSGTTAFVRSALAAGDPVLVAVPGPNLDLLRGALADVAGRVTFADMAVAGRNPGRIIPGVLLAFAAAHPGRRVAIIGEPIWPGRTEFEYPACAAHEALINAVFAGRDAAILCPYDVAGLDGSAVRDAWRTHPVMLERGGRRPSGAYTDPLVTAASFNLPLPPVPPGAAFMEYDSELLLAGVRRFVLGQAAGVLDADRADDLVLAANELTANTIEHAPGGGRITVWTELGRLVCQIDDDGHLRDPLAGRIVPLPQTEGGRGLILANQLCDLVRIHTTREGTSIRLHMAR